MALFNLKESRGARQQTLKRSGILVRRDMSDIRPGTSAQAQFFNVKNEAMLDRLLRADFQRRVGGELTEKQNGRLEKTVRHYMTEAYAKNPNESIQYLNKEVLTAVVPDYLSYLRRGAGPAVSEEDGDPNLRMDVNSRFGQIQNERQDVRAAPPPPPDFQISLEADGPTPLSRFEEIKRIRDAEAKREAETAAAMSANTALPAGIMSQELVVTATRDSPMGRFIDSDVDFRNGAEAARQRDQLAIVMREAERAAGMGAGRTEIVSLPDPRRILLGDSAALPAVARAQGIASANPTIAIPERVRDRPVLPQDVIKPQDDIVTYKEVEHNLFVYSADRDWVNNNTENRYNFSVNFDPANNQSGFGYNTATQVKFKNIVRVEFVKTIMPTEGIDVLASYNATPTYNTDLNVNVLSLPYLQVRIPELNVNGYGTNDGINNAFAAISYDAYWTGDSNAKNRGYARMIPKFLKCQKVYYPTPLATLQKLTFQIQRPDGTPVSTTNDTLDVAAVLMPNNSASTTSYKASGFEWIWIRCTTYFSKFLVSQGDRIVFKNVNFNSALKSASGSFAELINFLTRTQGHLVSDIGISTGASNGYADGANTVGYANSIIIRNNFQDPTTGATTVFPWVTALNTAAGTFTAATTGSVTIAPASGPVSLTVTPGTSVYSAGIPVFVFASLTPANNFTGVVSSYSSGAMVVNSIGNINGSFGSSVAYTVTAGTIPSSGRLINMNHQIQIIMRVITREMDAAAKLRPDNLQA